MFGSFREWISGNPIVMVGISAGLLVVALLIMFKPFSGSKSRADNEVDYFVPKTGEIIQVAHSEYPPVKDEEGNEAVKIIYYICDGEEKFVGYYEKYTPEAKKKREAARNNPMPMDMAAGQIIAYGSIDGKEWLKQNSRKFNTLKMKNISKCSGNSRARPWIPGMNY